MCSVEPQGLKGELRGLNWPPGASKEDNIPTCWSPGGLHQRCVLSAAAEDFFLVSKQHLEIKFTCSSEIYMCSIKYKSLSNR